MYEGQVIISQLMDWLPKYEFDKCVRRYGGNRYVKSFSCYDQFLTMAFAQLTIPGESSRHRDLSERFETQALSCRHNGKCFQEHAGRCQRKKRLANICRFRTGAHRPGQEALCRRRFRSRTGSSCLCIGLFHNRSVHVAFPLGEVPKHKECNQTSHTAGFTREYSHHRHNHIRQGFRCKDTRPACLRTWLFLYNGSGLSGFRQTVLDALVFVFFYHPCEKEFSIRTPLLLPCRQNNGTTVRPDNSSDRLLLENRLSRSASSSWLSGCRNRQEILFSYPPVSKIGF